MIVSKKLLWQQGAVAQYAEVGLVITASDTNVIVIPDHIRPHWSVAIRFGVGLFVEQFAWQQPTIAQMAVHVQSLKAVPGDTTLLALAYVTFHAICSAWNVDAEQMFVFDRSSGSFSFDRRGGTVEGS